MLERIIELTAENLGADAATITAETSFKDDLHADHNSCRCNELSDRASGVIVNLADREDINL